MMLARIGASVLLFTVVVGTEIQSVSVTLSELAQRAYPTN
jgi:hypothetical protein